MDVRHRGNKLVTRLEFSDHFPAINVFEYRTSSLSLLYGAVFINCNNLTAVDLIQQLDALERFLQAQEGFRHTISMGLYCGKKYVSWAYVHLLGIPAREVRERLEPLCSIDSAGSMTANYARLAVTVTIKCESTDYMVTIKSTVKGLEESIQLNNLSFRVSNPNLVKFQQNIAHIKHQQEFMGFVSTVVSDAVAASMTPDQTLQLLSAKVLAYKAPVNNIRNTWEAYLTTNEDGIPIFDFKSFQLNYDEWMAVEFNGGNATTLIGTAEGKDGYKKGKRFMNESAVKYLDKLRLNEQAEISDPLVQRLCIEKPLKHLAPMFMFADYRKNKKSVLAKDLFLFDERGAAALTDSQCDTSTYEVCSATFDRSQDKLVFDSSESSIVTTITRACSMFHLYMDVRTVIECCPEAVVTLYNLLNASPFRATILGRLTGQYKLAYLTQLFRERGFITVDWVEDSSPTASALSIEVTRLQIEVSKIFVVDGEVMVKDGKHRHPTHVRYSVGKLREDIQECINQAHVVQGNKRRYTLNRTQTAHFKRRGVFPLRFPSFVLTELVTISKMIYVLLPNGTMRFCIEVFNPNELKGKRRTHSELASMGAVLDAGELFLRKERGKWMVFKINNASGHYKPCPTDGLRSVEYLLRKLLTGNEYFGVVEPRCSLVNAVSLTRLSAVDETTQTLGDFL